MKLCNKHVKGYLYPRQLMSKSHACEKCGALAKYVIRLEDQEKKPEEIFKPIPGGEAEKALKELNNNE